ncbi:hypothetical protein COV24_04000 [candidate division WWE3 bacterium CG10_big_fil_rev_8_21_14_0_10_32_10]|uniref:Purple acid phosphatase N-terminal domain-containing protein n=1 Tax=candidate division WWE3 bacterium CG10_big_fil_rev_8_21_14_0_10_32_10 TaxID=1975090 RepID=A0A2H0R9H4_UNCKA|nr:MAG: hypothetical protein COV24_04000 [candidate division WWE3 bacterium CG10_big_fil_rev_8_21_14_0_10_32_10]
MLNQNIKGFLTLVLIITLISALYFGYKGIIEPNFINKNPGQYPVSTEDTRIAPQIEVQSDSAKVSWETPYTSKGAVKFSGNKQDCIDNNSNCSTLESNEDTSHNLNITNLNPNQEYFYKIMIDGTEYPLAKEEFFSFTTTASAKPDNLLDQTNSQSTDKNALLQEFKGALESQDMKFDFNNDGKVSSLDFPLYVNKNK